MVICAHGRTRFPAPAAVGAVAPARAPGSRRRPADSDAHSGRARPRPRQAGALALPQDRRRRPARTRGPAGRAGARARSGRRGGGRREGPAALRACARGDRRDRPAGPRPQGAGAGTAAVRRRRLLLAAAGRAGARFRRAMAHRVGGVRRRDHRPAGAGRRRTGARVHPHRNGDGRRARTAAPGPARTARRVASVSGPVHLVDASLYVFRAWHSMPLDLVDRDGRPANAVHGFVRFVLELLERQRPERIAIAFDESLESNFRNDIYPAYKANRDAAPVELKRQFTHCQRVCRALGLPVLADGRYEADDLIGAALGHVRRAGHSGLIVSADKDLSQLLDADDEQWDYARGDRWRADGVKARYGVHAHQIADYLGLTGDAIDNIPGVPGIGAKTAATLLGHFGSFDELYERLPEVASLRMRGSAQHAARLPEHRDTAELSRRLATIDVNAPLPSDLGSAERGTPDTAAL